MLERPNIPDERIVACLESEFSLPPIQIEFLPLGADFNTAVFRIVSRDHTPYFFKLRSGLFDETSTALPKFLSDSGIAEIIPPLTTRAGELHAPLNGFTAILYPFVHGHNGYEVGLSEGQWVQFGIALKKIHTIQLPRTLRGSIRHENFSPVWREMVRRFLVQSKGTDTHDPITADLAAYLQEKQDAIVELIANAERLAQVLASRPADIVLCHSDIHAGNLLLDKTGHLYIVDWDDPLLARKERDLMFVGGALFGDWRPALEEEMLFYRGYGETKTDTEALAYYRLERIVQDIAVECDLILSSEGEGQDRARELEFLKSNFVPNGTIELAYRGAAAGGN